MAVWVATLKKTQPLTAAIIADMAPGKERGFSYRYRAQGGTLREDPLEYIKEARSKQKRGADSARVLRRDFASLSGEPADAGSCRLFLVHDDFTASPGVAEPGKIGRMKLGSFDTLVRALDKAGVRYLVAGGLAVNAHGYLRFTRDVDLVLQLAPENIAAAFRTLEGIGYRPIVPVTASDLADPAKRAAWNRDKGMTVLNFWCDAHPDTPVDVFVTEPFDFDAEYARALVKPLGPVAVRFVSIPSLIAMKELAGRPQDRIDIDYLRKLADAGR